MKGINIRETLLVINTKSLERSLSVLSQLLTSSSIIYTKGCAWYDMIASVNCFPPSQFVAIIYTE